MSTSLSKKSFWRYRRSTGLFAVFLFNQTMQICAGGTLGESCIRAGGDAGVIFVYAALLIMSFVPGGFGRLSGNRRPRLRKARRRSVLGEFKRRLVRNPRLRGMCLDSTEEVEAALAISTSTPDAVVTEAASAVFLEQQRRAERMT